MRTITAFLILVGVAGAQPVVAPATEPVGHPRGQDIGGYNVTNSFETGYRFHTVDGNRGKYRSDVNFGNGVRLLGSNLTVHSKEGQGGYFDELLLNTQGLGNDPYEFANLRVQKNRFYRYDATWRENQYYNPALPIARGQHLLDTTRRWQDHSFVLLPQSSFRLFAGYSRNRQSGPGLNTVNLFDSRGDEFPLFHNIRREQNEYRLGAQITVAGVKFNFLRTWEYFKDDSEQRSAAQAGNNLTDQTALTSLNRVEPYHGSTKSWLLHLLADRSDWWGASGRFNYSDGQRNFIFDESVLGRDRFGTARNRQVLLFGDARRPVAAGNLTLNLFPSGRLTVVNHTAFHHTRMDGDSSYREINNATSAFSFLNFSFLGIRTISNSTDVNYQLTSWAGVSAGYHFSTRRIRSNEGQVFDEIAEGSQAEQENRLHAGRFAFRLRPANGLTFVADAEIGRADRPVFPISDRNYHALGARLQYRRRTLTLTGAARTNYNFNSASLTSHSSRGRNYSGDVSWSPRTWLGFDASYSRLHLDTASTIAYFARNTLIENDRSIYVSNIDMGYAGARISFGQRVDLFAGFTRVQDLGTAQPPVAHPLIPAVFEPGVTTLAYQTYPLAFTSPMARISVRLHTRLRWNAGYQHYRYQEDFLNTQDYRAHTGFTSLSWSF